MCRTDTSYKPGSNYRLRLTIDVGITMKCLEIYFSGLTLIYPLTGISIFPSLRRNAIKVRRPRIYFSTNSWWKTSRIQLLERLRNNCYGPRLGPYKNNTKDISRNNKEYMTGLA